MSASWQQPPEYAPPLAESDDAYDAQQQQRLDAMTEEQWKQALEEDRDRQARVFAGGRRDQI